MKVCKDLKLVKKCRIAGFDIFFTLWVVYIGKGILWERRENVGDEYNCM